MRNPLHGKRKLILNLLRKDARTTKTCIAKTAGMPLTTAATNIKGIENILGLRYVSLIDCRKLGYMTRAVFIIDAQAPSFLQESCVNNAYKIGEESRYLVECIFRGMKEMADFADIIKESGAVIKKQLHVIEDLKREGFEA